MSNKESLIKNKFNGDVEAYLSWVRANGAKGGRKKVPKGFAIMKLKDPERFKKVSARQK